MPTKCATNEALYKIHAPESILLEYLSKLNQMFNMEAKIRYIRRAQYEEIDDNQVESSEGIAKSSF